MDMVGTGNKQNAKPVYKEKTMNAELQLHRTTNSELATVRNRGEMELVPSKAPAIWAMKNSEGEKVEVDEARLISFIPVLDVIKKKFNKMNAPSGYRWALYALDQATDSSLYDGYSAEKVVFFARMACDMVAPEKFTYNDTEVLFGELSSRWRLKVESEPGFNKVRAIEALMRSLNATPYASPKLYQQAIAILSADSEVTFRPTPDQISDACKQASRELLRAPGQEHPLRKVYRALYEIENHIRMKTHELNWSIGYEARSTTTEDTLDAMFESWNSSNGNGHDMREIGQ